MMHTNEITLTDKLNESQKMQASTIVFDGFQKKLASVWLYDNDKERMLPCLKACLQFDSGLYALHGDQVLGVVGINTGHAFVAPRYKVLKLTYGRWGALWRSFQNFLIFRCFASFKHEAMHIDLLATAKEARGTGIGTKLLEAAFERAKEQHIEKISITVVDTNPRARQLYERLGFVHVETKDYGKNTASMGFSKESKLVKTI